MTSPIPPPIWFCPRCGWQNDGFSNACEQCTTPHPYNSRPLHNPAQPVQVQYVHTMPAKSRGAYIVLGLFLGGLGIHNFYAGHNWRGIAQLLLLIFTGWTICMIPVIWAWVIIELFATNTDGYGRRMT